MSIWWIYRLYLNVVTPTVYIQVLPIFIDFYLQKGLTYYEGVRRAKDLMGSNTDAQLRKYIVKYQQNLISKPKNDIITPTEHIIHLGKGVT